MKIQLVNSGNDESCIGNANVSSYPPLGIISIATTIRKYFANDVILDLIDGEIDGIEVAEEKIRAFKPDVLCVSMYCTAIKYTMRCAAVGRRVGATVILGNDHAKAHYKTLLRKSSDVNFVSVDEFGERTMFLFVGNYLKEKSYDNIPLLAYMGEDGDVKLSKIIDNEHDQIWTNPLDFFPLPDRLLLDRKYWERYLQNFKISYSSRVFNTGNAKGVTTINRYRGCPCNKHRCLYCGIGELEPRASTHLYWEDVIAAQEQVKANVFYECCDNMIAFKPYLTKMLDTRPPMIDANFLFYASAVGLDQKTCDQFKALGAFCLNFGFDSGNERALKILKGKEHSVVKNTKAAQLVTKNNLELHVSFVLIGLGSIEETKKSLENTYETVKWLLNETNTTTIECALLYPDETAPIGRLIWDPSQYGKLQEDGYDLSFLDMVKIKQMHEAYKENIYIEPDSIIADFVSACGADVDLLLEYQAKMKEYCKKAQVRFGYSQYGHDQ
jgi:radical SAM superfamily enzyme YgiQ (UPF0313 family)